MDEGLDRNTFDFFCVSDLVRGAGFGQRGTMCNVSDLAHRRSPVKHDLPASEELVNLLERQVLRLGIEEVDEGQEEEV